MPKRLADGLPIGQKMEGRQGTWQGDVEGDGDEDTVQVFVTNDPRAVSPTAGNGQTDEVVFLT